MESCLPDRLRPAHRTPPPFRLPSNCICSSGFIKPIDSSGRYLFLGGWHSGRIMHFFFRPSARFQSTTPRANWLHTQRQAHYWHPIIQPTLFFTKKDAPTGFQLSTPDWLSLPFTKGSILFFFKKRNIRRNLNTPLTPRAFHVQSSRDVTAIIHQSDWYAVHRRSTWPHPQPKKIGRPSATMEPVDQSWATQSEYPGQCRARASSIYLSVRGDCIPSAGGPAAEERSAQSCRLLEPL